MSRYPIFAATIGCLILTTPIAFAQVNCPPLPPIGKATKSCGGDCQFKIWKKAADANTVCGEQEWQKFKKESDDLMESIDSANARHVTRCYPDGRCYQVK
jgi:hypothetical protein